MFYALSVSYTHLMVFFIFLVSNMGGCLTPIGDPPLLMGFMRGVPFFWSLHLLPLLLFNMAIQMCIRDSCRTGKGSGRMRRTGRICLWQLYRTVPVLQWPGGRDRSGAVSYTHLDVYKRQEGIPLEISSGSLLKIRIKNSGNSFRSPHMISV